MPNIDDVNDVKPNANQRVTSQATFGEPGAGGNNGSTVYGARLADDGSLGFRGALNSVVGVGFLNANGSIRWFQRANYDPRDVAVLPASAVAPRGLVVVGGRDTDADGQSEVGHASLFSSTGTLLNEIQVSSDSSDVWFNTVVPVGESSFVACGGDRRAGVIHPFLAHVQLKAPGLLEIARRVTLQSVTGLVIDVVAPPSSPGEVVLAITSAASSNVLGGGSRSIHGLRAPWPEFDPVTVEWSREIASPVGAWVQLNGLDQEAGDLYMAGTVQDGRKAGGSATSGLVASYTAAGVQRWVVTDSLTQHSEGFSFIEVGLNDLYAVGFAARIPGARATNVFGYGLISKLDPGTGNVIANFTLGDDHYDSSINTATWTNGGLICCGYTHHEVDGGSFLGSFATVDVTSAIPITAFRTSSSAGWSRATALATAPLDGRGRATEEPRRSE